jgi:hypothetical protein
LALGSNAARVLYRLGYGEPRRGDNAMYREIQTAAQAELPLDLRVLQQAHQLLRRHGKRVCRRNRPSCEVCPLRRSCAAARHLRSLEDLRQDLMVIHLGAGDQQRPLRFGDSGSGTAPVVPTRRWLPPRVVPAPPDLPTVDAPTAR